MPELQMRNLGRHRHRCFGSVIILFGMPGGEEEEEEFIFRTKTKHKDE